jgi:hypothetical protein
MEAPCLFIVPAPIQSRAAAQIKVAQIKAGCGGLADAES